MSKLHKITLFILLWWSLMVVFAFMDEVRPPYASFQTELIAAFVATLILCSMYVIVFDHSIQKRENNKRCQG